MKAHRTDLVSFAFGLVFLALSAWWLLAQLLGLALPPVGWFLAGALILIGVFGLVGALRSGRPAQPESTVETAATQPVSEANAPVSGATTPLTAVDVPTSGAPLPSWEAERSTWDAPPAPEAPTAEFRTPEAPTAEFRTAEAPPGDVIHPAWLAHSPPEPDTTPVPDQAGPTGDEPTRVDHQVPAADDRPVDERGARRTEP